MRIQGSKQVTTVGRPAVEVRPPDHRSSLVDRPLPRPQRPHVRAVHIRHAQLVVAGLRVPCVRDLSPVGREPRHLAVRVGAHPLVVLLPGQAATLPGQQVQDGEIARAPVRLRHVAAVGRRAGPPEVGAGTFVHASKHDAGVADCRRGRAHTSIACGRRTGQGGLAGLLKTPCERRGEYHGGDRGRDPIHRKPRGATAARPRALARSRARRSRLDAARQRVDGRIAPLMFVTLKRLSDIYITTLISRVL